MINISQNKLVLNIDSSLNNKKWLWLSPDPSSGSRRQLVAGQCAVFCIDLNIPRPGQGGTGGRRGDSLGSKNRHYIAIFSYWLSLIFTDIVELCTPIHGSTSIPTFVFCNEYSDQILKSAVSNIFKVLPVLHYSCPVIIITLLKGSGALRA